MGMSRQDIEFAVTYDPQYRWWSVSCGSCGEVIEHKSFAAAFGFAFKHKRWCESVAKPVEG